MVDKRKRCFCLILNENVSFWNFSGLVCLQFFYALCNGFTLRFVPQLFVTKFGKTEAEAGRLAGQFSFYDDFVLLAMAPISAILMDVWHRKALSVLAIFGMGCVMIGLSFVTTLYPGFMTFNLMFGVTLVPLINSPFFSDYVAVEAMGPAVSFVFVFHILGDLVSSFACVWLH